MAVELDDFLDTVVSQAAKALELTDVETGEVAITDPTVLVCARVAYSQIKAFTGRDFLLDTYTELYTDEEVRIRVKHTPLVSLTTVTDDEGTELVLDTDYKVLGNYVVLGVDNPGYTFNLTSHYDSSHYDIVLVYDGGLTSAEADTTLENALVFQTIANYNRRSHLGVTQVTASSSGPGGGTVQLAPEKTSGSQLLTEVQEMLSSYCYYGSAVPWT